MLSRLEMFKIKIVAFNKTDILYYIFCIQYIFLDDVY